MIEPKDWPALLRLLDQALDLPDEAARERWLDALPAELQSFKPGLQKMLQARARGSSRFERPPALDAASHTARSALAPGSLVGPYRLMRELGRGGMSEVWLARHTQDEAALPVALKLPAVSLASAGFLERFARERAFLQRLQHPHIARLIDAGVSADGQQYLALEHVDGQPLTRYCDQAELGVQGRLALFQQVLQAVQHAHDASVLHRDLKPSNILVTADGQVRLLDFGIAKVLVDGQARETELTEQWGRMLTPDYASPEQRAGGMVDARTDVYALGVLLYELLSGVRPAAAVRVAGSRATRAGADADPLPPSECCRADSAVARAEGGIRALTRRLSRELDAIVLGALQHDPDRRTPDVATLADAIARVRAGAAVRPSWQRWRDRALALLRRHRAAVSLSSILLLALAGARHGHQAAADLESLFAAPVPEGQQVVLVSIGPDDHQRLFGGRSPLDAAVLQRLVARIVEGQPAALGVDIDTSAPAFAALPQALDRVALGRVVWGRDLKLADPPELLPRPQPVLGSAVPPPGVQAALALTVAEGSTGTLRWFQHSVHTSQGALPTLASALAQALRPMPSDATNQQRTVRFTRTERSDLPASVVLAPGFEWRGRIQGRLVLLGGRYDRADLHPTPLGPMHGLDVLANVVETETSGHGHPRPGALTVLTVGLVQLAMTLVLFERLALALALAASLGCSLLLAFGLAASGWFLAWPYTLLTALAVVLNHALVQLWQRRHQELWRLARAWWQRHARQRPPRP